jgi:hypothetical protein
MKPWRITWGDRSWTDEDVTAAHLISVADLLGVDSWETASPWTGPKSLGAWVAVLLASATADLDAAISEVYGASGTKFIGALTERI